MKYKPLLHKLVRGWSFVGELPRAARKHHRKGGLEITDPLLTAPAVNPRDLQSARVVCSCAHASCWDDNLSRNQVFLCLGLITKPSQALGHMTLLCSRWQPHGQSRKPSQVSLQTATWVGHSGHKGPKGRGMTIHTDTRVCRHRADPSHPPEASWGGRGGARTQFLCIP